MQFVQPARNMFFSIPILTLLREKGDRKVHNFRVENYYRSWKHTRWAFLFYTLVWIKQ